MRNLACVFGMLAGLYIDVSLSPGGRIPGVCSGGSLYSSLIIHIMLMPAAHAAMALESMLCIAWRLGNRTARPADLILFALWRVGMMALAGASAFALTQTASPTMMMLVMAAIMLALGFLPWGEVGSAFQQCNIRRNCLPGSIRASFARRMRIRRKA